MRVSAGVCRYDGKPNGCRRSTCSFRHPSRKEPGSTDLRPIARARPSIGPEALYARAVQRYCDGEPGALEVAQKDCEAVLGLAPDHALARDLLTKLGGMGAWLAEGRRAVAAGDGTTAIEAFSQALNLETEQKRVRAPILLKLSAARALAAFAHLKGDHGQAQERELELALKEASLFIKIHPTKHQGFRRRAQLHRDLESLDEAEADFATALSLVPQGDLVELSLIKEERRQIKVIAQVLKGLAGPAPQWKQLQTQIDSVKASHSSAVSLQLLFLRGLESEAREGTAKATILAGRIVEVASALIKQHPDTAAAYLMRAKALVASSLDLSLAKADCLLYLDLQQSDQKLNLVSSLLKLLAEWETAYADGLAAVEAGRWDEAEKIFTRGLDYKSTLLKSNFFAKAVFVSVLQTNRAEARDAAARALEEKRAAARLLVKPELDRGRVLMALGNFAKAQKAFESALSLADRSAESYPTILAIWEEIEQAKGCVKLQAIIASRNESAALEAWQDASLRKRCPFPSLWKQIKDLLDLRRRAGPASAYRLLEIQGFADKEEVKRAFRRMALKHHPDKGGSAERFREIREAHDILISVV